MRKTKTESLKTRQYLLNAALEVFYRQGVTRSTLQEIAQEAGVTRGALYWHFKNKEDLFEALFQRTFEDFFECFTDEALQNVPDAWSHLRENLLYAFQQIATDDLHRKFCSVLHLKCEHTPHNEKINELSNKYHHIFLKQISSIMKLCYQQGKLPQNIDLELATLYLESQFSGLLKLWTWEPDRFDLVQVAERILDTSMACLQNSPFLLKK